MSGPLQGVKILELTSTVSGPIAGMILGDQGADIIKIEPPLIGDNGRYMGDISNGMAAMFSTLNRNKRSLVLDLKDAADMAIFLRLVKDTDVLIENYRPGIVKKLGIDFDSLKLINPRLIYCSISGYGQSGPYQHRRVYDPLIQATVGASTEQGQNRSDKRPNNVRTVIFDKVCGYTAAQSVTAALFQRERSDQGEYLAISMMQSALYFQWPDVMWSRTWQGNDIVEGGVLADYFDIFRAKNGYLAVILVTDEGFSTLCDVLKLSLSGDPRYSTLPSRIENKASLQKIIDAAMEAWDVAELVDELSQRDVPAAMINTLDELFDDPQVVEQGAIVEVNHPQGGAMKVANTPFQFNNQAALARSPAPTLGQHSTEILSDLGIQQADIDRIEARDAANREAMANFTLAEVK